MEQTNEQQTQNNEQKSPAEDTVSTSPKNAPPIKAILAQKIGMTRVYNPKGDFIAVTVLQAGPCPILQVKTQEKDGYTALQIGYGTAKTKNTSKALAGHYAKAQVSPVQWKREIRIPKTDGFERGQQIKVDQFAAGDVVDVSGTNKGKGYAGVMKRHRFQGGQDSHGHGEYRRHPGSSGGQLPQRVFKGVKGPGHLGAVWTTEQRLPIYSIDTDQNLMLIQGSVPGPNGSCVTIKQTKRPKIRKTVIATVSKAAKKK